MFQVQSLSEGKHCASCAGCGTKSGLIELPQIQGDRAHLVMSANDQWRMLMNSWLKPLFFVIVTSLICSALPIVLWMEVSLVTASFLVGIVLCREVPSEALAVGEDTQNEETQRKEMND